MSLTEQDEEAFMKTEFNRRRTRLGAPPQDQLKKEIGLEIWKTSKASLPCGQYTLTEVLV